MNFKNNIVKFIILYFAIRLFSYLFSPQTPLVAQHLLNTIVSAFIFVLTNFLIYKKDERGWFLVAGEIILAGSGGYLKLGFISLRTALLLSTTFIYFAQKIFSDKLQYFKKFKIEHHLIFILITVAGLASWRGLYLNNDHKLIFSDFIPYLFLLYCFPLYELWLSDKFRLFLIQTITASIIANAIFILFTQIGFSSGLFALQDSYYHWYRDVALGKITSFNLGFYRLVLNEHLLLAPLLVYFVGQSIKERQNSLNNLVIICLLFILANNLTRIYLIAILIGFFILFSKTYWKKWLKVLSTTIASFFIIYSLINIVTTHGQSFGLDFFGIRIKSIAKPQIEDSSLSRMLLLPKIISKIKEHPILGTGLGDTIKVYSPIFKKDIITPHFDWGYLEIWAEMGLYGISIWIIFVFLIFYKIFKNKHNYNRQISASMLVILLIINITSPALFHVFGLLLLVTLISPFGLKYTKTAGGIIIGNNDKIVLVNNLSLTWWSLPKGGIEKSEDALSAAKREIFEETGLSNLTYIKDLGYYNEIILTTISKKYKFKKNQIFLFETNETKLCPQDPMNPEARWYSLNESLAIIKNNELKDFILKVKHSLN